MDQVSIEYRIKLSENKVEIFEFHLDGKTFDLISDKNSDPPQWTELSFKQCSHCPLNPDEHSHCPMALQLHDILERFHDTRSIDKVELEVITDERRVIQTLAIQNAIASMLDLIVPVCGCPKTAFMKPMARFHLPLASEEETVFRVTGMYLLSQYFLREASREPRIEFDGLTKIYEDLHIVNTAIASRLQNVTQSDSLKNAVALIDMYSVLVPVLLEDQLVEMRGFFKAYLPEAGGEVATTNYLEKAKAFSLELVPLEGEDSEAGGRPDWLEVATTAVEPEVPGTAGLSDTSEEKEEAAEETNDIAASILDKAEFRMELEPTDDEEGEVEKKEMPEPGETEKAEEEKGDPADSILAKAGFSMELEPTDNEEREDVAQTDTGEAEEPVEKEEKPDTNLLDDTNFKMELEPMEEEKGEESGGNASGQSEPSRSVFKLPDEE